MEASITTLVQPPNEITRIEDSTVAISSVSTLMTPSSTARYLQIVLLSYDHYINFKYIITDRVVFFFPNTRETMAAQSI